MSMFSLVNESKMQYFCYFLSQFFDAISWRNFFVAISENAPIPSYPILLAFLISKDMFQQLYSHLQYHNSNITTVVTIVYDFNDRDISIDSGRCRGYHLKKE